MSWSSILVNRLRFYIGDTDDTPKYSDDTLSKYIALAAIQVASEIDLSIEFNIDTDTPEISPDPTSSNIDIGIGNLFVLKAGVLITRSEVRKDVAKYGIKIKDDLTSYDGTAALASRGSVLKQFEEAFKDAKWDWEIGNRPAVRGIFGAFTPDSYYTGGYWYNDDNDNRKA